MDRKLHTVPYRPEGSRYTIIDCHPGFDGPYFRGEGDTNLLCGSCQHVLVEGEVLAMLTLYLCCPGCGTYNLASPPDGAVA